LKNEKTVSLVYTGEGGTSRGDFHDALNFAGVFKVPCIIVVENNQYAISVPRNRQTSSETIAQKAIAYGIKGIQVDGNDIFAVYKAAKEAVDNARAGNGPTLIENVTYRQTDHSTSDDAKKYRSDKEVQEWAKKDPLLRLEKYMRSKKMLDDKYKNEVAKKAISDLNGKDVGGREARVSEAKPMEERPERPRRSFGGDRGGNRGGFGGDRRGGFGGGRSLRAHNALVLLALAIKLDNEERPDHIPSRKPEEL